MTLPKQVVLFACVLAALIGVDRALSQREVQSRRQTQRIAPFIPPETFHERPVAAIKYVGDGDTLLYIFHDDMWRTLGFNSAPALTSRVSSIVPALSAAQGVIQTNDPAEAEKYGFGASTRLELKFCGPLVLDDPTGDVIMTIEVGHSIASTGGCYARIANRDAVWAIDVDLRSMTARDPDRNLPPMVDPHIIPEAWPGFRAGLRRITIEKADMPPIICTQRRDAEASDQPSSLWHVRQGLESADAFDLCMLAYTLFLQRAEFIGLPGRRSSEDLGLDAPQGRVRLEPNEGPPLELVVGGYGPHGGVIVYNAFSAAVFEVDRSIARILLPDREDLTLPTQNTLWDEWMR